MRHLKFNLPGLPRTTNAGNRAHWAAKTKEKNHWHELVWAKVKEAKFRGKPMEKAQLTLTRCSSVEPDFDGLVSTFKHVIDGLVQAGVLTNDKVSVIGQPKYNWVRVPRLKGFIIVEVQEVE